MDHIKKYWAEILLSFLTFCGVCTTLLIGSDALKLTPVFITLNLGLVLIKYQNVSVLWPMVLTAALIGTVAEAIGVQTGIIFGEYIYGSVLGPKIFDTPLMVGVMWALVMIVIWAQLPDKFGWWRVVMASLGAVVYDLVLEHFATRFDLWQWNGSIPLSNYIGWFLVASLIGLVYQKNKWSLTSNLLVKITLPLHIILFVCSLIIVG